MPVNPIAPGLCVCTDGSRVKLVVASRDRRIHAKHVLAFMCKAPDPVTNMSMLLFCNFVALVNPGDRRSRQWHCPKK